MGALFSLFPQKMGFGITRSFVNKARALGFLWLSWVFSHYTMLA
jgi:hypothetical protein